MVRKKIDNRIRVAIENNVLFGHRSLFVIVGEKAKDQVVILHHMLSKATIKARPSVLWCYKKDLAFTNNRKKKLKKQMQKRMSLGASAANDVSEEDTFAFFLASTNIRYCFYNETQKILGNTFGMCVLQDFEALTPNLLARTVETVEGGGLVVLVLQEVTALNQLCTLNMDVHARYRTEAHSQIVCRFNERFILSLSSCESCLVIDDTLNVLPASNRSILNIEKVEEAPPSESVAQLDEVKTQLAETQPIGSLVNVCKTLDQAESLLKMVDVISDKTLRHTVSLTAARGRGKSAALGLAIAAAVDFGYSNIFVTSPSPENVRTLFEFIYKGFDVLKYEEHTDYSLVQSTNPNFNKAIIRINIFKEHRQTIQYIKPTDASQLGQAELVVVDEAASIPLPVVRSLLGPYLVFLSSTISGYEGTGRSLSLKLIAQLRQQHSTVTKSGASGSAPDDISRSLTELTLKESIRYQSGDCVESWLNGLLCLESDSVLRVSAGCPLPEKCSLYYVNRDTLFSYHSASEEFLRRLMSIYVAAHYKNSPNDLQMLSDAPAHHLFVLLPPVDPKINKLPEILVVVQVALEGEIRESSVEDQFSRGRRAAGDLIPWTVSQQFQDASFASLAGARIVRIATHPDYQRMGFGLKALELLESYYSGNFVSLNTNETETHNSAVANESSEHPKKGSAPLLLKLDERPCEHLDYVGVSFGLTAELFRFWKRRGMKPMYVRQTSNDITGEHSCIMLKPLGENNSQWCKQFNLDFQRRFVSLLSYEFRNFAAPLALNILYLKDQKCLENIAEDKLRFLMIPYDLKRLELYAKNLTDYHLIMDLVPILARLYFTHQIEVSLSGIQATILLGVGLQHKSVDTVATELDMPPSQTLAVFCKLIKKFSQSMHEVMATQIKKSIEQSQREVGSRVSELKPTAVSLDRDLEEAGEEGEAKMKQQRDRLLEEDEGEEEEIKTESDEVEVKVKEKKAPRKYDITVTDEEWNSALEKSELKKSISIRRSESAADTLSKKRPLDPEESVIDSILQPKNKKGDSRKSMSSYEDPSLSQKTIISKKHKKFLSKRS